MRDNAGALGFREVVARVRPAPSDTAGDRAAGGLVPVRCEPERGHAVCVEPNVWMRHSL
ncbi:hypothetical protein ACIHCM_24885 [Streptomyces sp. NPDC052023]|uniref:hypothetical protein n=1 Tax=Streptomyces sp. NPDC052023 TaxID=3365681 RepID=UPI0037D3D928